MNEMNKENEIVSSKVLTQQFQFNEDDIISFRLVRFVHFVCEYTSQTVVA